MCAYFAALRCSWKVWGLSASSEAATGGQVGAAVIKVQHPLPAACLVSAVTHSLNPVRTST